MQLPLFGIAFKLSFWVLGVGYSGRLIDVQYRVAVVFRSTPWRAVGSMEVKFVLPRLKVNTGKH